MRESMRGAGLELGAGSPPASAHPHTPEDTQQTERNGETSPAFSSRCLLTNRAGMECCLQVGLNARPVSQMARELGVCWDTVMAAVREHGEPPRR